MIRSPTTISVSLTVRTAARLFNPLSIVSRQSYICSRFNSSLPPSSERNNDLLQNDAKSRLPKWPLGKNAAPTLLPKRDSPRVGPNMTFAQLIQKLRSSAHPELIYAAETHRLWFIACYALAFVVGLNLFELLDMSVPLMIKSYQENEDRGSLFDNLIQLGKRFSIVAAMTIVYVAAGSLLVAMPSRLVRRIEYIPGPQEFARFVVHPLLPGRPSPVITLPLDQLTIGARAKVWTGDGFYGTASRTSFFYLLWEEGRRFPWIVDRSGWFWGDGRVQDVLFGKEPVALAEKGLSYDDILKKKMLDQKKASAELRRELGPAWRFKMQGQLMKEDLQSFSSRGKSAVLQSVRGRDKISGQNNSPKKQIPSKSQDGTQQGSSNNS